MLKIMQRLGLAPAVKQGVPPLTPDEGMAARKLKSAAHAREQLLAQQEQGWAARPDVAAVPFTLPFDWSQDPFSDLNWCYQLNAWRPLDPAMALHHFTGDRDAFQSLVDAMLDWARHEREAPADNRLWGDMEAGIRAAKLAFVLSQPAFESLAEAERSELVRLARAHMKRLRDPGFIARSNHALAQIHGLTALIRVRPDLPESRGGDAYVARILARTLKRQLGEEGVHLEHSPSYHLFALTAFRRILASGWHDATTLPDMVRRAEAALPWLIHPDGRMSAIGDSAPASKARAAAPPPPEGRPHISKLFPEAGYAVVRSDWDVAPDRASMLLVTAAFHSISHKHADDLSFELFEAGCRLIVDTGKCTYNKGDLKEFSRSARAHNVIELVEGQPLNGLMERRPSGGGLSRLVEHDWGFLIEGELALPDHDVRHRRRFLYRPGDWLVLLDEVDAGTARDLAAWLHLDPALEASPDPSGRGWRYPDGAVDYVCDQPFTLDRVRGREDPRQGWMATGYHQLEPNDALAVRWRGAHTRLASVIRLRLDAPTPTVTMGEAGFEVSVDGRRLAAV